MLILDFVNFVLLHNKNREFKGAIEYSVCLGEKINSRSNFHYRYLYYQLVPKGMHQDRFDLEHGTLAMTSSHSVANFPRS